LTIFADGVGRICSAFARPPESSEPVEVREVPRNFLAIGVQMANAGG
jgi:hypothetical protein